MDDSFTALLGRADLTQSDLAAIAGVISDSDMPRQRVWRWVHGRTPPEPFAVAFLWLWCRIGLKEQERIISELFPE